MSKINIYACGEDLRVILASLETEMSVKYVEYGHFGSPEICNFGSHIELVNLSKYTLQQKQYLILEKEAKLTPRLISGTGKYAFDQLLNPDSVVLQPGGYVNDNMVIAGNFSSCTVNDSVASEKLFRLLQKNIKKNFTKVKAYWVGPDAYRFLLSGGRLTLSPHTPPDFDLKIA